MWHERDEYNTSATHATWVRHEWKILILITTRVKTYFCTVLFTIWKTGFAQVQILLAACWKFARVRISDNGPDGNKAMPFVSQPYHKNFIWRTTFWKCLVSMPKCIYKMHHKNHKKFFNNVAPFSIKTILCEYTNILFSKSHWKLGKMNARFWKNK